MTDTNNMKNTILITGCSSGFGKATAIHFLARGWNVIATMRSPKPDSFEADDSLLVTPLDVTDAASIGKAIGEGIARFGKIDAVVNNAGIGLLAATEATPDEVVRQVFDTNTFGLMAVNRAIIPHMRQRGSGTIINVTSSIGIVPMPYLSTYAASKWAVEGYSEALAYELGAHGIRVKLVEPGLAPDTEFAANAGGISGNLAHDAYKDGIVRYMQSMQEYPFDYTSSEDVAEAVHQAAIDGADKLRYPAGADAAAIAELRQSIPQQEFIERVRAMTGTSVVK